MNRIFGCVWSDHIPDLERVLHVAGQVFPGEIKAERVENALLGAAGANHNGLLKKESVIAVGDLDLYDLITPHAASVASAGSSDLEKFERLLAKDVNLLDDIAADFAVARYDPKKRELLLARDALSIRPLFWARSDQGIAFASDHRFLISAGFASGDLDELQVRRFLAVREYDSEQTAFSGVHRVVGGEWVRFSETQPPQRDVWFQPGRTFDEIDSADPINTFHALLSSVVEDRVKGHQFAVGLSGGRDSGAVAAAASSLGLKGSCLTMTFPEAGFSEATPAKQLADTLGHSWSEVPIPTSMTEAELLESSRLLGTPAAMPSAHQFLRVGEVLTSQGCQVFIDGQGGDFLFSAPPVSVWELLLRGSPRQALKASNQYHRAWTYSYLVQVRAGIRALLPKTALEVRDRRRPFPPWLSREGIPPHNPTSAPRSSRGHAVNILRVTARQSLLESQERLFRSVGIKYSCPLLDRRVISMAMSLPLESKVPVPFPKPILEPSLLHLSETRVKGNFNPYFRRLAKGLTTHFSHWVEDSYASQVGLVDGSRLGTIDQPQWVAQALAFFGVESWLRLNR